MNNPERVVSGPEINRAETIQEIPIDQQANFKGSYSELLFSRMNNPVVRKQLLDMIEANEKWLSDNPETVTELKKDPITGETFLADDGLPIFEQRPGTYNAKSREELEKEFNEGVNRETALTRIDFSLPLEASAMKRINPEGEFHSTDNSEAVVGVMRDSSVPLTEDEIRDRSLIEAHEKGHVFRNLRPSKYLEDKFKPAFDVLKVTAEAYYGKDKRPDFVTDSDVNNSINGYLFDFKKPVEIMERMSQLKNYFGMRGDEKFTIQHLMYAKEHYRKDVNFDNHMQAFFDAITEETEFAFLRLINSVGV